MINSQLSIIFILSMFLVPPSSSGAQTVRPIRGCGEQCIKLLCKFYGKDVSEQRILDILKPGELGEATFKDLHRSIKKVGLDCYAFKGTVEDLIRIKYPVILHFKRADDNPVGHFLVALSESNSNKLVAYDPAFAGAPFDLTSEMLNESWSGAGLVVFPRKSFRTSHLLFVMLIGAFFLGSALALLHRPKPQNIMDM